MKIVGAIVLHYGSDFLGYAVKSIYDHVDEILISVSELPWGYRETPIPNPDSIPKMREAAYQFGDPHNKIKFQVDNFWPDEGTHRDEMTRRGAAAGADLLLRTDADEIWDQDALAWYLEYAAKENARDYLLPFVHLWRSFDWCCSDESRPVRIVKYRNWDVVARAVPEIKRVYHFGYARKPEDIRYKMAVHAHRNEWMPEWYEQIFMRWPTVRENLHPCNRRPKPDGQNWWDIMPFDKSVLPTFMQGHPYYNLEII